MNTVINTHIFATDYDRDACDVGVLHLGFGAFHRAHQAVYLDDYMAVSGDLRWGIAAVNLRPSGIARISRRCRGRRRRRRSRRLFSAIVIPSADGDRSRCAACARMWHFTDWQCLMPPVQTQILLALKASVHLGHDHRHRERVLHRPQRRRSTPSDPFDQAAEVAGEGQPRVRLCRSTCAGLWRARVAMQLARHLTIACCDNIRQNGKMLRRNLLGLSGGLLAIIALAVWVECQRGISRVLWSTGSRRVHRPAELGPELSPLLGGNDVFIPRHGRRLHRNGCCKEQTLLRLCPHSVASRGHGHCPTSIPIEETKIRVS